MRPGSLGVASIPADPKSLVASSIFLSDATVRFSLVTGLTIPMPSISALAARPLEKICRPYQRLRLWTYGVQNDAPFVRFFPGCPNRDDEVFVRKFDWFEGFLRKLERECRPPVSFGHGAQHCLSLKEVKGWFDVRADGHAFDLPIVGHVFFRELQRRDHVLRSAPNWDLVFVPADPNVSAYLLAVRLVPLHDLDDVRAPDLFHAFGVGGIEKIIFRSEARRFQ